MNSKFGYRFLLNRLKIHATVFPLQWAIAEALVRLTADLGLSFVTHWELDAESDQVQVFENAQGIQGWIALLNILVHFHFKRDQLTID